jgi:DNA-binding NarL/FixJ family response regulator
MAIRLTVEASDPEVEGLLEYLQTQKHPTICSRISVLERAMKWLQASDPASFWCDARLPSSGHLEVGRSLDSHSAPIVDKPSQQPA